MTMERIQDGQQVARELKQDPQLWAAIGGEGQDLDFPSGDDFIYLRFANGERLLGYVIFHRAGDKVWKGHANFLSNSWGKRGRRRTAKAGAQAFSWLFDNTDAEFILGEIPNQFPQVQQYAVRLGMRPLLRDDTQATFQIGRDEWASLTTY